MAESFEVFYEQFHDEIHSEAHAMDCLREEIFAQKMGEILEEYGEIESFTPSPYRAMGMKVDGYSYDDEFNSFTLVVSLFLDSEEPAEARVTGSDVQREFKHVLNFFLFSMKKGYERIEVSNESFELSRLIYECRKDIRNLKLILITDATAPKNPAQTEVLGEIEISKISWDIERTHNFNETGEREKINIDFRENNGGSLPCISMDSTDGSYTTYLAFVPGSTLADMYSRWGIKMLDMNVRVFLSARGGVNKGLRKTILEEPGMFCAYNNGITVYSESVEVEQLYHGLGIGSAHDFQIINGGQTTASLYHTRRKDRAALDGIQVLMKLVVINDGADKLAISHRVSQYSNTQNKVQIADLAANESPHPEIQIISNKIFAPDPTGGSRQTYWFYERSRGSYDELRNLTARTDAQKRSFDALRPKKQKFDKVKFGKVWNAYLRLPHLVSLGGQKNFARFNEWLREQKEEDWVAFFKKTVALLVLWNETERITRKAGFQGYHHNIIAYTLSWFFQLTESRVDLDKIWQKQQIGEPILDSLSDMCHIVNTHIRETDRNISEYCKKVDCWNRLLERKFTLSENITEEYLSGDKRESYESSTEGEQEAIVFCSHKGSKAWFELAKWLKERSFLTPKARSQCFNMGRKLDKGETPSVALSIPCKRIWEEATVRGWNITN